MARSYSQFRCVLPESYGTFVRFRFDDPMETASAIRDLGRSFNPRTPTTNRHFNGRYALPGGRRIQSCPSQLPEATPICFDTAKSYIGVMETSMGRWAPRPAGPRGTFPRMFGGLARDEGLMTTEEALRKMTSYPAGLLGISDRGVIQNGAKAEFVVFEPRHSGQRGLTPGRAINRRGT